MINASNVNNFIIILIYGSLVLLSLLKLTNPLKVNNKANFWFGIFLFLWSTFWMDEILSLVTNSVVEVYSIVIINFIQFFTPIIFYFSVLFYTNPSFKFKFSEVKYLVLPIMFLMILLVKLGDNSEEINRLLDISYISLILGQALFYTGLSYVTIAKHQKRIQQFSANTEGINLNWLEYIIIIILSVFVVYLIYSLFFNAKSLNVFINSIFLLVVYFICYYSLKQKEIYPIEEKKVEELITIEDSESEGDKRKLIPDEDLQKIKLQLETLMEIEKPYLDSELNLVKLSELLSVSTHHLSYVINTGFQKNFFQYINEFRIDQAKILLKNNHKLSILGIAYESGFNSKTSFNTTFKKLTNLTPSEYKKGSEL